MRQYRLLSLVVFCAVAVWAYDGNKQAPPPKVPTKTDINKIKKAKVLTPYFLATNVFRGGCPPTKQPAAITTSSGVYICDEGAITNVDLKVTAAGLDAPNSFRVETNTCLRWRVSKNAGDTTTAKINAIEFIDRDAQGSSTKPKNALAIGSYCQGLDSCVMFVTLPKGRYRFNAKVNYGTSIKTKDPEVEVLCSPCGEGGM
jgi:hypothetical protein